MIIADITAVLQAWSVYSNFEWEANFHQDQEQYEHATENWSQSFYSVQSYYMTEDLNFDDDNIYDINSDQTQDNQNFSSEQKKSE